MAQEGRQQRLSDIANTVATYMDQSNTSTHSTYNTMLYYATEYVHYYTYDAVLYNQGYCHLL